jgi:hypothetical protein
MRRCSKKNCAMRSNLGRGERLDCQGVYVGLHHWPQRLVNQPVTANARLTRKCLRDDRDPEVAETISRTGMAGMQVALVLDFQEFGLQGIQQPVPNGRNSLFVHLMFLNPGLYVG